MSEPSHSLRPIASRIPVLMYHQVGTPGACGDARYTVAPHTFAQQMERLADQGYLACTLDDFLDWHAGRRDLPAQTLMLSFDDGFCGVLDTALPVLRSLEWPFTVFIVTDRRGQQADWITGPGARGRDCCLMNDEEIGELLAAGASVESHTATHCSLSSLADTRLEDELERSRSAIQALTGKPARALAYPYGDHDDRVIGFARRAGYEAAFSVNPGFNRPQLLPMALRRLDVHGSDSAHALLRKVRYGTNDGSLGHHARYLVRRARHRLQSFAGLSTLRP